MGQARRLADMEAITVNGEPEKNLHRELKPGDVVQIGKREPKKVAEPAWKNSPEKLTPAHFAGDTIWN